MTAISRRVFVHGSGCVLALAASGSVMRGVRAAGAPRAHPARFWRRLDGARVQCELCPKKCVVEDRERGFCGVRENRGGQYVTLVWGQPCAVHVDPIEKKPFFHFLPGSRAFSLATAGCNLECKCCQNWEISQSRPEEVSWQWLPPEAVVREARAAQACITFTYSEPIVFLEYCIDTARAARRAGLRTSMVSGGSGEPEPLREACKVLDAVKIDLKGFTDDYYRRLCKGKLAPVLKAIETVRASGVWLELVHLCIPGANDSDAEVRDMCRWVKQHLGPDVPLHFTRFSPLYQMKNVPPTPPATLVRCRQIGMAEGLRHVYTGNVPGLQGETTFCPRCGATAIVRHGYQVLEMRLKSGRCAGCGAALAGVWT